MSQTNLAKYFDKSYKIEMKPIGKIYTLTISAKNASVGFTIKKEKFSGYTDIPKNFVSDFRLNSLYKQVNKKQPPAPQKFTRKMLCYGLCYILHNISTVNLHSIISLEADPSPNSNLINKVYIPMGFTVVGYQIEQQQQQQQQQQYGSAALMCASVDTILSWCNKNY